MASKKIERHVKNIGGITVIDSCHFFNKLACIGWFVKRPGEKHGW